MIRSSWISSIGRDKFPSIKNRFRCDSRWFLVLGSWFSDRAPEYMRIQATSPFMRSILLLLALLAPAVPAAAQVSPPAGADIVFVVDQSGSMSKGTIINANDPRCKPERLPTCPRTDPTDPDGLAIQAVNDGLAPIFERLLLRSLGLGAADAQPEEYRFGLVLFGGDDDPAASMVTAVPLTRIAIERDGRGMLQPNLATMVPTATVNLGETAFSRAFGAVCAMLDCAAPPAGRKRVVVLLTDGQPSLDELPYDPAEPAGYFDALRERHAVLFGSSELWVLGLDRAERFWPKTAPYWAAIAPGRTFRLADPSDIASRLRAIAQATVGEPPGALRECDGAPFTVDPYRATLMLSLEYTSPGSRAEISMPGGQRLAPDTPGLLSYSRSAQSEVFILARPEPGSWQCRLAGAGVNPRLRTLPGAFELADMALAPADGALVSACRDYKLALRYSTADGRPFAELPAYPLAQELWLGEGPSATLYRLLPGSPAGERWVTGQAVRPDPQGRALPARIDVRLPDGTPIYSATRQLSLVDPALPCMQPSAPEAGSVSQIYRGLSATELELAVTLTQRGGPSTPQGVFREDLGQIVSGKLQGPGGLSQSFALQPDPLAPGRFVARLPGLEAAGDYTFTAALKATTLSGAPYEVAIAPVAFSRAAAPGWVAARWAVWAGSLLGLLALAGLLVFVVVMLTGPYPRGTLVLEQRSGAPEEAYSWQRLASIPLQSQRVFGLLRTRWVTARPRTLRGAGLRALKVRRVVRGKSEGVQVTLLRDQKRAPISFQFTKHQEIKTFDGKYRIVYEAAAQREG